MLKGKFHQKNGDWWNIPNPRCRLIETPIKSQKSPKPL